MPRRIVGQCNTVDFRHLEHLADAMARGIDPDLTNLTKRQQLAVGVLGYFQRCDIKFDVLLKVKEVLCWDLGAGQNAYEFKLIDPKDQETRNILNNMRIR